MSDKYLNENGIAALKAWVVQYVAANSGGSAALASLFQINMADEYFVTNGLDSSIIYHFRCKS